MSDALDKMFQEDIKWEQINIYFGFNEQYYNEIKFIDCKTLLVKKKPTRLLRNNLCLAELSLTPLHDEYVYIFLNRLASPFC